MNLQQKTNAKMKSKVALAMKKRLNCILQQKGKWKKRMTADMIKPWDQLNYLILKQLNFNYEYEKDLILCNGGNDDCRVQQDGQ